MSQSGMLSNLAIISPTLNWGIETVLFLIFATIIWILIAFPSGLIFIALNNKLKEAYQRCRALYDSYKELAKTWALKINNIREEYSFFNRIIRNPFEQVL
jgi:hypothetical protein